jgi:DNA mismatch repair protein MutL
MGRIRILDPRVADQIAAGELVERPASVAKELIENSLDAGAQTLQIRVQAAGVEELRVLDDGEGMDEEDLLLSVRRHATSKLSRLDQLTCLTTLGFRGEALPSIGSVSRMTLESSPDASGKGTRVRIEGGKVSTPEIVGHPRGTTVTVRSLFFNAPARRKFLRAASTERGYLVEIVSRTALAHFERRWHLEVDAKTVLDLPPARDRKERVAQVFGETLTRHLVPFVRDAGPYRASGFASRPDFTRPTTRDEWLFVNGRPVKDRALLHAISGAYHTLLPRGRFPLVLLFLEVPPERADVNVHPTKAEVKLADPRAVHELVRLALRRALETERPVAPLTGFSPPPLRLGEPEGGSIFSAGSDRMATSLRPPPGSGPEDTTRLFEPARSGGVGALVPLAQYRESYILAADAEGLVVVDQHVAHERVLYEKLLRQTRNARVSRQALLFPVTVEVGPAPFAHLVERSDALLAMGFIVEPFGRTSLLVREVPSLLGKTDVAVLLQDLAGQMGEAGPSESFDRFQDRIAAATACHAAVKVNHPLTLEKMTFLLEELSSTDSPMTCPHGRPILLRLDHRALERSFHRR